MILCASAAIGVWLALQAGLEFLHFFIGGLLGRQFSFPWGSSFLTNTNSAAAKKEQQSKQLRRGSYFHLLLVLFTQHVRGVDWIA